MKRFISLLLLFSLAACDGGMWNDPYPADEAGKSILYAAFTARPKHLDPVQAYSENEYEFLAQIYQPPLQYHYLKRPYMLVPQAAATLPQVRYYDKSNKPLPQDAPASKIAFSVYEIHLRPGLMYQPHPALAKDASGQPRYMALTKRTGAASARSPILPKPARAPCRPPTMPTRSSGWRILTCIRRFLA